jgi:hypothetical protein
MGFAAVKSVDMVPRVLAHTQKYPEPQRFVLLVLAERTEATKTRRRRDARLQAEFHLGLTRGARPGRGLPWLDHGARGTTA